MKKNIIKAYKFINYSDHDNCACDLALSPVECYLFLEKEKYERFYRGNIQKLNEELKDITYGLLQINILQDYKLDDFELIDKNYIPNNKDYVLISLPTVCEFNIINSQLNLSDEAIKYINFIQKEEINPLLFFFHILFLVLLSGKTLFLLYALDGI